MIAEGWYDRDFIRDWSNGALLVRDDTGRFLPPPISTSAARPRTTRRGIRLAAVP